MNRLEKEMAYLEKEETDQAEKIREGKKLLAIWLQFRIRTLLKNGFDARTILSDVQFECRKVL